MASEDWQKASSRKVHLMLKDDQEQITRSREGWVVAEKRSPRLGKWHVQRPGGINKHAGDGECNQICKSGL